MIGSSEEKKMKMRYFLRDRNAIFLNKKLKN